MRRVLMATALLLALPAPASAAFGELPFRPVTSSAVCLGARALPVMPGAEPHVLIPASPAMPPRACR